MRVLLFLLLSFNVFPQDLTNVVYLRNYDGDTITVNIPNVHDVFGKKVPIRLAGIDAPEIRTKDVCERSLAIKAKKFVAKIMSNAKIINLSNVKRGKYFRVVADVKVDGRSLSEMLLDKKLAYKYFGSRKNIDWCNFK